MTGGAVDGQIASITQRRRVSSEPCKVIPSAEYVYCDGVGPRDSAGDSKKVVVKDVADAVLEPTYFRNFVAVENNAYEGGRKYVFRPRSYSRLAAYLVNPGTATDAQIAPCPADSFEYDEELRVTKEEEETKMASHWTVSSRRRCLMFGHAFGSSADSLQAFDLPTPAQLNQLRADLGERSPDARERGRELRMVVW